MKLIDFIICDDIRTEINNKVSLIGVYNDVINFIVPEGSANTWPKGLRLGLFIRLDMDGIEEQDKIGKLVLESTINGEVNFHAEQIIDTIGQKTVPLGRMIISVVFNQFNIHKTGDMALTLSFYDKNQELMEKLSYPGNIKITEVLQ